MLKFSTIQINYGGLVCRDEHDPIFYIIGSGVTSYEPTFLWEEYFINDCPWNCYYATIRYLVFGNYTNLISYK